MSVYFITARDLGICKIGLAGNPEARRASLQTASPAKLTLEATLPGSRDVELKLHKRFAAHRVNGEWFTITDEIEALISEAATSAAALLPAKPAREAAPSDEERVEQSLALSRQMLGEAMESFARVGCVPCPHPPEKPRPYEPVAFPGGQFRTAYAVRDRETRKTYCSDLSLTWDQADGLCDVFAEIAQRQVPLDLEQPKRSA